MISFPGRIPIHIFPFFWLLIFIIGWLNTASILGTVIWAVVILISVLIHEYGHAITALIFGQEAEINLVGFGGLTKRQGPKISHWKEFLIVFNGPLAGFLLFILAFILLNVLGGKKSILVYALNVAVNVNLFWTIINLLPVLPLDGGHLLRILLEGAFGVKGLKISFFISIFLAVIVALYAFLMQQILIGALFFMLAFESYRAWADIKSMAPQDTDQQLQDLVQEGVEELKEGRSQEALNKFTLVRQQAPKGILYVTATQYAAHILADQGHYKQAYDWLLPLQNRLSADYVRLLQQLAFRTQEWEQATKIGQQAYQQEPSIDTALINALSYAILGEATPSVGWLRCAIQLGLPNVQNVIEKREFDAIRNSAPFLAWRQSYEKGKNHV
jgi:stage IV sporulation protein FB